MSGAIMPGALGDAVDGHGHIAERHGARRELGEGVGGHDRLRRVRPAVGRDAGGQLADDALELRRVERLADHPGRGEIDLLRPGSRAPSPPSRRRAARSRGPCLPVKALALPELTRRARAVPLEQGSGAPVDRRRAALRAGEHARHLVPSSKTARSTSVRFLYLIPASAVAKATPAMAGIAGYAFGASGEMAVDILVPRISEATSGLPHSMRPRKASCRNAASGSDRGFSAR